MQMLSQISGFASQSAPKEMTTLWVVQDTGVEYIIVATNF